MSHYHLNFFALTRAAIFFAKKMLVLFTHIDFQSSDSVNAAGKGAGSGVGCGARVLQSAHSSELPLP